jgi:predicted secreted protein
MVYDTFIVTRALLGVNSNAALVLSRKPTCCGQRGQKIHGSVSAIEISDNDNDNIWHKYRGLMFTLARKIRIFGDCNTIK